MMTNKPKFTTKTLVTLAMLAAAAYISTTLMSLTPPLVPIPPLRFDPKDVVLLFAAFLYGAPAAILMLIVVAFIEMGSISETAQWGMLMNVVSSSAYILPAALIYRRRKTLCFAIIGLSAGVISVTGVMMLWNYIVIPFYSGVPREVVAGMLFPLFVPFNLFKGSLNALLAILLYKPLMSALSKARLIPTQEERGANKAAAFEGATVAKWIFAGIALAVSAMFLMFILF